MSRGCVWNWRCLPGWRICFADRERGCGPDAGDRHWPVGWPVEAGLGCRYLQATTAIRLHRSGVLAGAAGRDDYPVCRHRFPHTSVILARLVWKGFHRRPLSVVPLKAGAGVDHCESVLLIGDKVVRADVGGFPYRVDLGGAWRAWTGLPFVFAAWGAPVDLNATRKAGRPAERRP